MSIQVLIFKVRLPFKIILPILDINPLSDIWLAVFFLVLCFSLYFIDELLWLNLIHFLSPFLCVFSISYKKHCLIHGQRITPKMSSKTFIVQFCSLLWTVLYMITYDLGIQLCHIVHIFIQIFHGYLLDRLFSPYSLAIKPGFVFSSFGCFWVVDSH